MSRILRNELDDPSMAVFTTSVTPTVMDALEQLHTTGLFGLDLGEVIERLLCERIRDLEVEGWIKTQTACEL